MDAPSVAESSADYSLIIEHKSCTSATDAEKRSKMADRVRRARGRARLLALLDDPDAKKRAKLMAECGGWLAFRTFFDHPETPTRLFKGFFCQQRLLCDCCAARRGHVSMHRTVPKVLTAIHATGARPYLLTLTARNQPTVEGSRDELLSAYKLLLDRRKKSGRGRHAVSPFARFEGGIISFEAKRGASSGEWHFHGHALVLIRGDVPPAYFAREERWAGDEKGRAVGSLADAWSECLGYTANCDLRPLRCATELADGMPVGLLEEEIKTELCEVFKYALKLNDLAVPDHWEAFQALHGKRLLRSFGALYGVKEAEQFADDCSDLAGYEYVENIYRFVAGEYRLEGMPQPFEEFMAWAA